MDESAPPTHIRRIDGAERDAVRVKQRSQFQSPFSDRFPVTGHTGGQHEMKKKPTPVAYEEQRGLCRKHAYRKTMIHSVPMSELPAYAGLTACQAGREDRG